LPAPLPPRPFLYPIVDAGVLGLRPVGEAVGALAQGGARILQLRAKDVPDRQLWELAREAQAAALAAGARLLVNDRPDVARLVGAAGVHLGQHDLPPAVVRGLLGPEALIGLSTHSLEQVRAAAGEPVDYVAVGPVFPTRTKANPDPVVGLALVREARALVDRPLIAIGGITRDNAASVVAAGADGVAVISDLLRAEDLASAARSFWEAKLG
jgi:thiamine-phosphate pyrophosphorylase